MNKKSLYTLIIIGFFLLNSTKNTSAQAEDLFFSYTGGFKISLPKRTSGASAFGTSQGINFYWDSTQINYEIGFSEKRGLPLALKSGEFSFSDYEKQYLNPYSQRGEKIYEKEILVQGYSGKEYKFSKNNAITIARILQVNQRIYRLYAEVLGDKPSEEAKVLQVFDTFILLDKKLVETEMLRKVEQATPNALPQSPVVTKQKSDADGKRLKGKVKSILTETTRYNSDNQPISAKPSLSEEFNESGNLLKTIEYNQYGDASVIRVYGYIGGKRVNRRGNVRYESDITHMVEMAFPKSAKPDQRFDESFNYKYLNSLLVEENKYFNNGIRELRIKYFHSPNKIESHYFFGTELTTSLKGEELLDEKGNVIKIIQYRKKGKRFIAEDPYMYEYKEFDEAGNWIKRTSFKWYGVGNQGKYFPNYDEVRTINYYK